MADSMNLKWCKKNLELHSQAVYDAIIQEHPDAVCEIVDCADKCNLCTDVPFAVRNNASISGRDARGLYVKLTRGFSYQTKPSLPGTFSDVSSKTHDEEESKQVVEAVTETN